MDTFLKGFFEPQKSLPHPNLFVLLNVHTPVTEKQKPFPNVPTIQLIQWFVITFLMNWPAAGYS